MHTAGVRDTAVEQHPVHELRDPINSSWTMIKGAPRKLCRLRGPQGNPISWQTFVVIGKGFGFLRAGLGLRLKLKLRPRRTQEAPPAKGEVGHAGELRERAV